MTERRNYREYTTVDKGEWGPGPWQDEPDKVQWIDEATGLDCLIHRGPSGSLCGYVGVPEGHPLHGIDYSQCSLPEPCGETWCEHSPMGKIDVHGGLTFADSCADGPNEAVGVCHIPEDGRPDHVWWFGFDCAHAWDISPASTARGMAIDPGLFTPGPDETYRDRVYVEREIASLARQLHGAPR